MFRPGNFDITDKAIEKMMLPKEAKVLEIGCGEGETVERLEKKYGYRLTAIDKSLEMVSKAKKRGLKADIKYGDGEFLEDIPSLSLDAVIMECVLSRIKLADEALHEAYCVLKKSGKLFISDIYMKDPDPEKVKAIRIEAERQSKIMEPYPAPGEHHDPSKVHDEETCSDECAEDHRKRFYDFRFDGLFIKEPFIRAVEETGFEVTFWEDRTADLIEYTKENLMRPEGIGYFMLIAEKGD